MNNKIMYCHPVTGDIPPLSDWLDTEEDNYIMVYAVTKNYEGEWVATGDYYEATRDLDGRWIVGSEAEGHPLSEW